MKKFILSLSLLALLPMIGHAAQIQPPVFNGNAVSGNVNQYQFENLSLVGAPNNYRMEASTPALVAVLLVSGQGLLYEIDNSSGAATDSCIYFDSASVNGINAFTTYGKAITPYVFAANSATGCTSVGVCGSWSPRHGPIQFTNGLVGIKVGGGNNSCLAQVRGVTGSNP